jgi:hypothetical protein
MNFGSVKEQKTKGDMLHHPKRAMGLRRFLQPAMRRLGAHRCTLNAGQFALGLGPAKRNMHDQLHRRPYRFPPGRDHASGSKALPPIGEGYAPSFDLPIAQGDRKFPPGNIAGGRTYFDVRCHDTAAHSFLASAGFLFLPGPSGEWSEWLLGSEELPL